MRKMRHEFTWNQLTLDQRQKLEAWLFNEDVGYANALARVKDEFGVEATIAGIVRFYRLCARERRTKELAQAQAMASKLNDSTVSVAGLREAAVHIVGEAVLKLARDNPKELEQLVSVANVLLKNEETEIRRARLNLAQGCFDYEATAAAQKDLPQLRAYLIAIRDNTNLDEDEKLDRIDRILYGWNREKSHE
jgi:hypothetical protein